MTARHISSMRLRRILLTGLLTIGLLAAAVVLFFAGDHDDPDQDADPRPAPGVAVTLNAVPAGAAGASSGFATAP